jgi:hypothetical protein
MKLPNGHRAAVDERKVREYLLSHSHPIGRFKARVFASVGFHPGNWQLFAQALVDLAATGEATLDAEDAFGRKYLVPGLLRGPTGTALEVVSVWIVPSEGDTPRLVTVYPR